MDVPVRTLGCCKKISFENEIYTRQDKLSISAGLGLSAAITAVKDIIEMLHAVSFHRNVHGTMLPDNFQWKRSTNYSKEVPATIGSEALKEVPATVGSEALKEVPASQALRAEVADFMNPMSQ